MAPEPDDEHRVWPGAPSKSGSARNGRPTRPVRYASCPPWTMAPRSVRPSPGILPARGYENRHFRGPCRPPPTLGRNDAKGVRTRRLTRVKWASETASQAFGGSLKSMPKQAE